MQLTYPLLRGELSRTPFPHSFNLSFDYWVFVISTNEKKNQLYIYIYIYIYMNYELYLWYTVLQNYLNRILSQLLFLLILNNIAAFTASLWKFSHRKVQKWWFLDFKINTHSLYRNVDGYFNNIQNIFLNLHFIDTICGSEPIYIVAFFS